MRALTVQQPWAWAIFHGKNIENRTQQWAYRGPLAIHAGMRESDRGIYDLRVNELFAKHWYDANFGHFLGVVDLVDCHPDAGCCKPWGESAYVEHGGRERRHIVHLVLENPRELAEPIPCRGALGLWTPPADVCARLNEAVSGDTISDLVDWQLANRSQTDVITHVCRVCLTQWTGEPMVCPECGVVQ